MSAVPNRVIVIGLLLTFLLVVADAGIFGKAKQKAKEAAAAHAAAQEVSVKNSSTIKVFGFMVAFICVLVGLMIKTGKSAKQKAAEKAEVTKKKQEETAKKILAANQTSDKKVDPNPQSFDTAKVEKSKQKAKQAAKNNARGSTGTVTGITAAGQLSAKKIQVSSSKDYFAECIAKNGTDVADAVKALTARHAMVNPAMHPDEPYMECFEETWLPLSHSRDLEGEKLMKNIATVLKAKGTKFEDPTFPADFTSLFADPTTAERNSGAEQSFRKDQDPFLAGVEGIEWKRPEEWGSQNAKVVVWSGGVDPDDVAQGRLGNCYYLAAMAGCALGDDDILLKDLCIEDYGDVGLYGVKFFVNGKWATVVIDDRIPCIRQGDQWWPIFCAPKEHSGQKLDEKEIWPMIFEKAWAKLHLSYEATAGGLTQDAASYLSGGIIKTLELERGDENINIWHECMESLNPEDGHSYTFLSCAVRADEDPSELGLITGHAYSILKMKMTSDGKKFVNVRNPWGEHEWLGRYSDKSPDWTDKLKAELGFEDENDGSFFMLWDDFVQWFEAIEICDPTFLSSYTEGDMCRVDGFSSHWVAGKTAGGDISCVTFKYNPACEVTVDKECPVVITLFQPDVRCMFHPDSEDMENQLTNVYIRGGDRSEPELIFNCMGWERQKSGTTTLRAGWTYEITASTFAPGMQGAFWISLSGHGLELKPVPFKTPTDEHAAIMAENWDPYGCCAGCHNALNGPYYQTEKGPNCEGCATGKPPPTFIRPKPNMEPVEALGGGGGDGGEAGGSCCIC